MIKFYDKTKKLRNNNLIKKKQIQTLDEPRDETAAQGVRGNEASDRGRRGQGDTGREEQVREETEGRD